MKKLGFLFAIVVILITTSSYAIFKDDSKPSGIIYTTLDLKQDYEIISIIAAPVDITPGFGDPVAKAYKSAWEKFEALSKSIGADAVVGVKIELQNMNGNIVGRFMLYGTAVKFKNTEEKKQ